MEALIAKADTKTLKSQVRRLEKILAQAAAANVKTANVKNAETALTLLNAEIASRAQVFRAGILALLGVVTMLTIYSANNRHRVTLAETADGVEFRVWKYLGEVERRGV